VDEPTPFDAWQMDYIWNEDRKQREQEASEADWVRKRLPEEQEVAVRFRPEALGDAPTHLCRWETGSDHRDQQSSSANASEGAECSLARALLGLGHERSQAGAESAEPKRNGSSELAVAQGLAS
jgi:hypothetical protein